MVKFTETVTEDGDWDIIAVPENEADMRFLSEDSPASPLGYVKLVLRHALEAAEDAEQPAVVEAIQGALEVAEKASTPLPSRRGDLPLLKPLEGGKG